jgi:hypothetical protein
MVIVSVLVNYLQHKSARAKRVNNLAYDIRILGLGISLPHYYHGLLRFIPLSLVIGKLEQPAINRDSVTSILFT